MLKGRDQDIEGHQYKQISIKLLCILKYKFRNQINRWFRFRGMKSQILNKFTMKLIVKIMETMTETV